MKTKMDATQQELEQAFLKLPTLSHIGMALMQFAFELQRTKNLQKDYTGVFRMTFVSFSFPKGEEKITMFVRNVDVKSDKIQEFGFRWLPLKIEDGQAVCEISHHGQLGQAAKYIQIAHDNYLTTRQIPSNTAANN